MILNLYDLLSNYLKHRLVRPATAICYKDALTNLTRFGAAKGIPVLTLEDLTVNTLLEHRHWCLENMRPTSYNKHRRHLRALLNFAVQEGNLKISPLAKVTSAPAGQRRPKIVPANWYSKTMALLNNIEFGEKVAGLNPSKFWSLAFSVLHFTGMRRRQLVELQWDHVLWHRTALLLATEGSKSRREWLVPLPKWVVSDLRLLHGRATALRGARPDDTDQVFCLPLHQTNKKMKSIHMSCEHLSRAFSSLSTHLGYTISSHRVGLRHGTSRRVDTC